MTSSQRAVRARQRRNWKAGVPCYCATVSPCDFCAGLAAMTGPRADEQRTEQKRIQEATP